MIGMSWFDYTIFALSAFGAGTAGAVFVWAARSGHPALRAIYCAAAAMCALYIASYAVVTLTPVAPAEWSKFMRPVSLVFWWVAMIAPTAGAVLIHRGTRAGLLQFAKGQEHGI